MRELQTITKEQYDLLVSAIAPEGLKCKNCKKKLTNQNFAFLARNYCSCDNPKCLKIVIQECEIYDMLREVKK